MLLLIFLIICIMIFLCLLCKYPEETAGFLFLAVSASILGSIIWLFIKHTKICLLIFLSAVIIAGVIVLIILISSSIGNYKGFSSSTDACRDRKMMHEIKQIRLRIKKNRSHCMDDVLIQNDADKLLIIAKNLYVAVAKTPASKFKSTIISPEIQRLNRVVELLEQLNVMSAIIDAKHLLEARKNLEEQIGALNDTVNDIFYPS